MDENKKKALGAALMQIEKQFGKGALIRMGDDTRSRDIETVSRVTLCSHCSCG
jgi:recombination protein RecA